MQHKILFKKPMKSCLQVTFAIEQYVFCSFTSWGSTIGVLTLSCLTFSPKVVQHLGPATDFYKKLALDCSGQQTAVDLFLLSSQYSDLASLGKEYLIDVFILSTVFVSESTGYLRNSWIASLILHFCKCS